MRPRGMEVAGAHLPLTVTLPACLQIIKDLQLLAMVAVLVLADAVLLLTWVFSDPVQCFRSLSVSVRVKG